jgi:hypothetical protein
MNTKHWHPSDCGAYKTLNSSWMKTLPSMRKMNWGVESCRDISHNEKPDARWVIKQRPHMRKAWIRDLTISCDGWNAMIIHTAACITTRVVCDLTEVGGAAASYSVGNGPLNVHSWTIGSELTQFDADAFALARTAETLAEYYTEEVIPPLIFSY